jgi:predicted ATPase/GAF domain-containing protein
LDFSDVQKTEKINMTNTTVRLNGYHFLDKIYESFKTLVYRGLRESDQKIVIIKLLKSEYPTFEELARFRNQYTMTKNLDLPGVIKPYCLENYGNGFALIMEDMGGISLSHYLNSKPLSIKEFFNIALQMVKALEDIYSNRVIHKNITPQNTLINPETKQIKLTDFSLSSLLPRETKEVQNPNVLEGTLAYMSPEQTGRMNRGIDYRTDFYSLGIIFYQLLAGQCPFSSNDPMDLVHCHINLRPRPLVLANSRVPVMINDIIVKLMEKNAEDRYQSAFGIRYDLERCQQQWQQNGHVMSFILGERDISDRFQISEKLYGRETGIKKLLEAFERVSQGTTEMMLVTGISGIGKTALINEIHKPIVRQQGYFIKGKFDQFKRNIPFSALTQAFQMFVQQLLTESTDQIRLWKIKILKALGNNGQIIVEVIPELEKIIGLQSPVQALNGNATQNRFNLLFQKFVNVFTAAENPLVIFLDDLQWADSASLKLIQMLMTQTDTHGLLLIGAYRDNEVNSTHPLTLTLNDIRKTLAKINTLLITPLDKFSLNYLVAKTLHCPIEQASPLTILVFQKTKGNPFFTNQFLKCLYEEGIISYNSTSRHWQCDIAKVKTLTLSNDVIDFMVLQLQKLPENTQMALKFAACIGNQFDLETLAIVHEKTLTETAADLWKSLQEEFITPVTDIYKFLPIQQSVEMTPDEMLSVSYKFLHDRIQQAAYSLIPENQKLSIHLKIGQLLKKHFGKEKSDEKLFDILNQLNMGKELITAQSERNELAQLNLKAGRKAMALTTYAAASRYLTVGLELLSADSWQTQYDLTLTSYELASEVAYLNGDFFRQEQLSEIVLRQANSLLDKINTYEIKIKAYIAQTRKFEAVITALPVLKQLDIELPYQPNPDNFRSELQKTQFALEGKSIDELCKLPLMTDKNSLAAMRLLSSITTATYQVKPELFPLLTFKQIQLSIKYGNAPDSIYGYACYGILVENTNVGHQFGKLAYTLLEQLKANEQKARVYVTIAAAINPWKIHISETLKMLLEGYQNGLEIGDLEWGGHSVHYYSLHSYFVGSELTELVQEITAYNGILRPFKQENTLNWVYMTWQAILNLTMGAYNPCQLTGFAYNESQKLPQHQQADDKYALGVFYLHKLILSYLFQEELQAFENTKMAEQYLGSMMGTLQLVIFHFYDSLIQLAVYPNVTKEEQLRVLEKVTANQEKMQNWANDAPMNFRHKLELVEAERYRVLGEYEKAMDNYDRAIAGAKENKYPQEEALANELATKFYLAWGKEKIAQLYLTEAYYGYARWGAKAKVKDLDKRYSQLLVPIFEHDDIDIDVKKTLSDNIKTTKKFMATESSISAYMDFTKILKASQAIAKEIQMDKLFSTLMRIIIENAEAEKGVFILNQDGELLIQAQCETTSEPTNKNNITVLQSLPVEKSNDVPISLINSVSKTLKTQIIKYALKEVSYADDPYIISQQPKSVLCTPILNQGKLVALIYLENNHFAFLPEHLEAVRIFSSQIVISLKNALLYQSLEQKVNERTEQFFSENREITMLNEYLDLENVRMKAKSEDSQQQQQLLPKKYELHQIEGLDIAGLMDSTVQSDYYDVLQYDGYVIYSIDAMTKEGAEISVFSIMMQLMVPAPTTFEENDPVKSYIFNHTIPGRENGLVKLLNSFNDTTDMPWMNTNENLTFVLLKYQDGFLFLIGQHKKVIKVPNSEVELVDTINLEFTGLKTDITNFPKIKIPLNQGNMVVLHNVAVLYTDNIIRFLNSKKVEYGLERLCGLIQLHWQRTAEEIRQMIIDDVQQHIGTQEKIVDNITLLVLKQKSSN